MKANELMIGDWVLYNGDGKPYPVAVAEITSLKQLQVCKGKDWFIAGEKYFEPIPLTAEILEKNGFVVEPEYCYDNPLQYCEIIDGLWISISGEDYFEGKLEYVHQLQHALKLCGIDKEIVL